MCFQAQWTDLTINLTCFTQALCDQSRASPGPLSSINIKTLAQVRGRGKKVAVLGDMLELGKESRNIHLELGKQIARHPIDSLYLVGKQAGQVKRGALLGGIREEQVIIGKNHRAIARALRAQVKKGDWLLFKGSRGMQMERVIATFKKIGA